MLFFSRKNGLVGCVVSRGQVILPFEFSNVEQVDGKHFRLPKGEKFGYLLTTTFYPPIRAEYELIRQFRNVPVSDLWSFLVYRVKRMANGALLAKSGWRFFDEKAFFSKSKTD